MGDRVAVVGGGMVGLCVARLLAGIPGAEVTVVDVDPQRAEVAAALGARFALPADAAGDRDLVVHASASAAGLQLSLDLLAPEGTVLDLSWYGDAEVSLRLGGAFHSASAVRPGQPGRDGVARPPGSSLDDRPAAAGPRPPARPGVRRPGHRELAVRRAPRRCSRGLADGSLPALCHTITYGEG